MSLRVKEIFYSLQGEGGRQGEASIFVRLSGCNLRCDFCDTDFSGGNEMRCNEILDAIRCYPCQWLLWTGGEPTLQLTDGYLDFFRRAGYQQAIESNGTATLSPLLDYTAISPKVEYARIDDIRKLNPKVNEVRMTVRKNDPIPSLEILPDATFYFLSPVFSGNVAETEANINYCVQHVMQHSEWRLSLQMHKWIGIR